MTYTSIGLCHRCHTSGIQVSLTKIGEKDGMVTEIAICEKCRDEQFVHEP